MTITNERLREIAASRTLIICTGEDRAMAAELLAARGEHDAAHLIYLIAKASFDRAFCEVANERDAARAKLRRAESALVDAGWVDNGGEAWKPPLGPAPHSILASLDAAIARAEKAEADLRSKQLELDACSETVGDWKRSAHHAIEKKEAWKATTEQVCKILGCDVDSVEAQAAMFREKATTLLQERDAARAEVERLKKDQGDWRKGVDYIRGPLVKFAKKNLPTLSCVDIGRAVLEVCAEVERLRAELADLRAYRDRTEAALVELASMRARRELGNGWVDNAHLTATLRKLGLARDAKGGQ